MMPSLAHRPRRLAGLLAHLVAMILVGVLAGPGLGQADAGRGTPVLGPALLSADQLAGWYASLGVRSESPTEVRALAAMFIDEGRAQGVRGDLAFAQAMLETGYLRYGGQVLPSDNNFSGLGACDSCRRGLAFASPTLGVRAQIQHLWAYAFPGARSEATARPNADIRFDLVSPTGRAPLWEQMGNGNWATDPGYADKVISIYRGILDWAGPPDASPAVPLALPAAARIVRASSGGGARVASWLVHRTPLRRALRSFGPPDRQRQAPAGCLLRWSAHGLVVFTDGICADGDARARWLRLLTDWRTQRGLAVGDGTKVLGRLYPAARRRGAQHWLVAGRDPGSRVMRPRLRAEVRNGRVRALIVNARTLPAVD